jgi:hypothetical protein
VENGAFGKAPMPGAAAPVAQQRRALGDLFNGAVARKVRRRAQPCACDARASRRACTRARVRARRERERALRPAAAPANAAPRAAAAPPPPPPNLAPAARPTPSLSRVHLQPGAPLHAGFAGHSAELEADMDLDSADAGDPAQVSEYAADIFAHFKSEELTKSAKHGYMASQTDINEKVRRATAPQGPRRTRERWGPGVVREHITWRGLCARLAAPRARFAGPPLTAAPFRLPWPPLTVAADARHPDREPPARAPAPPLPSARERVRAARTSLPPPPSPYRRPPLLA